MKVLICCILSLFISRQGFAGSLSWDDEHPKYNWAQSDLDDNCKRLNEKLVPSGTPIKCEVDDASFQKHLDAQLKIKVHNDRDMSGPEFYCGTAVFSAFDGSYVGGSGPGSDICPACQCKKALPLFLKSVKTIRCKYIEGKKKDEKPTITLKAGVLQFEVFNSSEMSAGPFDLWIRQLRKLFPEYDECLKAHSR